MASKKFRQRKTVSEARKGFTKAEIQQRNKKANANYYQNGTEWHSPAKGNIYA